MDEDSKNDQFDAALPLPGGDQSSPGGHPAPAPDDTSPAAEITRKKIDADYSSEPSVSAEAEEVEQVGPTTKLYKHQQFVNTLLSSGKSLVDIQTSWHQYYQGLPDAKKHEVWREFGGRADL